MNLLYDLTASQPNADGKFHGGGKYARVVFLALASRNPKEVSVFGVFDKRKSLDPDIAEAAAASNIFLIGMEGESIGEICKKHQIDRFYSALPYSMPGIAGVPCEVLGTIHGLRELELPLDWHSLKYFRSLKKAKAFLKILASPILYTRKHKEMELLLNRITTFTVSNHTKYALMSYFPRVGRKDIGVFYSPDVTGESNAKQEGPFEHHDYFFLVSGNRWLKNNLRAAIALDQLFTERRDVSNKVIITGVKDSSIYLQRLKNKDRFVFYDYVDEDLLIKLYKNAYAFLYLSLNEGFGYPPLEAMKFGIPVVTSPFTSIPEVCGDSVLYGNPYSIPEIKNRILQLSDQDLYDELSAKGKERYKLIKMTQDQHLGQLIDQILRS